MSTGGEVANALVCKTSIRGFNSRPVLHTFNDSRQARGGTSVQSLSCNSVGYSLLAKLC